MGEPLKRRKQLQKKKKLTFGKLYSGFEEDNIWRSCKLVLPF